MQAKDKQKLIDKITALEDNVLLEDLNKMLNASSSETIYELSDDQLTTIAASEEQIKYGKTISHENAKKQTNKWLEK